MATELGKAYVQIVPSAKGIKGQIENVLDAGNAGKSAGKSLGSGIASTFKTVIATAGIGKAISTALNEGGKLQQSIGGVGTLFKDSADTIKKYASEAYKGAGLSANEYMELSTSFAASLLQSLDGKTQVAAEATNTAINDMADNSAKFGTSMESLQMAYAGFSKGQFTLLDNLKLGYGGTKTEMERLLKDAQALTGVKYDIILKVIKGGYSSEPVAHVPVRQDSVYQLVIAQIRVNAGAVKISQLDITDTRSDKELCGIVAGAVDQIDFSQIQAQFDAYMVNYAEHIADYTEQMQADFDVWFDNIKNQLSQDAAGNLQAQIDDLEQKRFQRRNGGDIDIDTLLGDDVQGRYWINPSVSEGSHPFSSYYTLLSFTDLQLALNGNGKVALRTYVNDKWDEWTKYYSAIEVDMMVNKSISGISDKNTIAANSSKNITITYNIPEGFEISHVNVKSTGFAGLIVQGSIVNRTTNKVIFVVYNASSVSRECTLETEAFYRLKQ